MNKIDFEESKLFLYPGVIHIHSNCSDGSGDIYEITAAAKKAGLYWILITDHNKMEIDEGIYNDVYVIIGEEISPKSENHYLALGIKNLIEPSDNPGVYIEEVKAQGGFGFAAHPDESEFRKNKAHPIRWNDKSFDVDGIEIWNWFSDWADNYNDSCILKMAYAYFFRNNLIKGPHLETLKWWDELNLKKDDIVPAIGGADAHALKISKYIVPLKIFPYEYCFKTLNNVLITDRPLGKDFTEVKASILNLIRSGNNLILNRLCSKSKCFPEFEICNEFEKAHSGQSIALTEKTYLNVKLFQDAEIKIFKDGEEFYCANADNLAVKIWKKGKYRFEARYKNTPWIYSNPILVK